LPLKVSPAGQRKISMDELENLKNKIKRFKTPKYKKELLDFFFNEFKKQNGFEATKEILINARKKSHNTLSKDIYTFMLKRYHKNSKLGDI